MSLLCFIYHFAVVATTQFHSNMCLIDHFVVFATAQLHTNNNNKLHVHKITKFSITHMSIDVFTVVVAVVVTV